MREDGSSIEAIAGTFVRRTRYPKSQSSRPFARPTSTNIEFHGLVRASTRPECTVARSSPKFSPDVSVAPLLKYACLSDVEFQQSTFSQNSSLYLRRVIQENIRFDGKSNIEFSNEMLFIVLC